MKVSMPSKQRLGQSWIAVMLNIFDRFIVLFLFFYVLCILCIQVASCRLPDQVRTNDQSLYYYYNALAPEAIRV